MIEPSASRPRDRIALAVLITCFVVGLACLAMLANFLLDPARSSQDGGLLDAARRAFDRVVEATGHARRQEASDGPRPAAAPPLDAAAKTARLADPQRRFAIVLPPETPHVQPIPMNAAWAYEIFFGPGWQYAGRLDYETAPTERREPGARMSWTPDGGRTSTWFLGIIAPNHPSHANTRFPGFFMHPAYFPSTLKSGEELSWEFPWQREDPTGRHRLVRRFDVKVERWERVAVTAGVFDCARMYGTLRYVDNGETVHEIRYVLWYAPAARQIVRLVWLGRSPDEARDAMVAELSLVRGLENER